MIYEKNYFNDDRDARDEYSGNGGRSCHGGDA